VFGGKVEAGQPQRSSLTVCRWPSHLPQSCSMSGVRAPFRDGGSPSPWARGPGYGKSESGELVPPPTAFWRMGVSL